MNRVRCSHKKFKCHLWNLVSGLVPLALVSSETSIEEKRKLVTSLKLYKEDWTKQGIELQTIVDIKSRGLHDLMDSSSICALNPLRIDVEFFLNNDPEAWDANQKFEDVKQIVSSSRILNVFTGRSVSLMSDFNESLTKSEVTKQKMINVVEEHRKRIPDVRKMSLRKSYDPRT